MATEDFTFPVISDACPRFLDSPPLWRVSSTTATTNPSRHQEDHDGGGCSASKPAESGGGDGTEDRMDMLWEDFNEELHDKYCSSMSGSEETAVKVGCVPGMAAASSTTGGAVVAARRAASLLMFMKILRKLFQLHHSPSSHKPHSL